MAAAKLSDSMIGGSRCLGAARCFTEAGAKHRRKACLVEEEDLRAAEERPGDGDALPLPAGEAHAALAHARRVAVREVLDERVRVRLADTGGQVGRARARGEPEAGRLCTEASGGEQGGEPSGERAATRRAGGVVEVLLGEGDWAAVADVVRHRVREQLGVLRADRGDADAAGAAGGGEWEGRSTPRPGGFALTVVRRLPKPRGWRACATTPMCLWTHSRFSSLRSTPSKRTAPRVGS